MHKSAGRTRQFSLQRHLVASRTSFSTRQEKSRDNDTCPVDFVAQGFRLINSRLHVEKVSEKSDELRSSNLIPTTADTAAIKLRQKVTEIFGRRYCSELPMPKYLAPKPPVRMSVS